MMTPVIAYTNETRANVDPRLQEEINAMQEVTTAIPSKLYKSAQRLYYWYYGMRVVSDDSEELGEAIDDIDGPTNIDVSKIISVEEVVKEGGKIEYTSRIRKRTPFVVHVVRHLRGTELGQLTYTDANKLHVDRAARDFAKSINMRSTDFADALPLIIATYFFKPSRAQIEASEIVHSQAFVNAIKSYQATYVGRSGRNPLKVSA